jgi:hypothetical protein
MLYKPLISNNKRFGAPGPSSIDFSSNLSLDMAIHIRILEIQKFDL